MNKKVKAKIEVIQIYRGRSGRTFSFFSSLPRKKYRREKEKVNFRLIDKFIIRKTNVRDFLCLTASETASLFKLCNRM